MFKNILKIVGCVSTFVVEQDPFPEFCDDQRNACKGTANRNDYYRLGRICEVERDRNGVNFKKAIFSILVFSLVSYTLQIGTVNASCSGFCDLFWDGPCTTDADCESYDHCYNEGDCHCCHGPLSKIRNKKGFYRQNLDASSHPSNT